MASDPVMNGDLARRLERQPDEEATWDVGVAMVVERVQGCTDAGITLVRRGKVSTGAATSDLVRRGDALQYQLREGPCLDTLRVEHSLVSNDLAVDRRWPTWGRAVIDELGVRSMMSVLLYADVKSQSLGALNMYGRKVQAFDSEGLLLAETLAAQLAIAIDHDRQSHHQEMALVNRTLIGQAEGILMERLGIDAKQAFAYLTRISQNTNQKLTQVAIDIVTTRALPDNGVDPAS